MADEFFFDIPQDFPGLVAPYTAPNSDRLKQEIQDSSITVALDRIDVNGAVCCIYFKADLSEAEEDTLDAVVAAHTGKPLGQPAQYVKIDDTEGLPRDRAVSSTEDFVVPVYSGQALTKRDIQFPFDMDVTAAEYFVDFSGWRRGDYFQAYGVPRDDPAIDYVAQAAAKHDVVIKVGGTMFQYCRPGYCIEFTGQPDNVYRIMGVDPSGNLVQLEEPLDAAVGFGSTIHLRRPFIPKKFVQHDVQVRIGDLSAGSSPLPSGNAMRIHYHHVEEPQEDDWMYFTLISKF